MAAISGSGSSAALLDNRSKAEQIADAIETRIRSGDLKAGAHLGTKTELAASFGVAYSTFDAALRVLSDRGLIRLRPGAKGGVTVSESDFVSLGRSRWPLRRLDSTNPATPRECASVVLALQPLAVADAIQYATAADRRSLRDAARQLERAKDSKSYRDAHEKLHETIVATSHNEVLQRLIPTIVDVSGIDRDRPPDPPEGTPFAQWASERAVVHRRIVDAILASDLPAALRALQEHGATTDGDTVTAGYQALRQAT